MLFLRFTTSPSLDLQRGRSLWFLYDSEEAELLMEQGKAVSFNKELGEYVWEHCGLSGHALEAETLEQAMKEIKEGSWFGDWRRDSWAIFEGERATRDPRYAETNEGCDFTASEVLFYIESPDNLFSL